MIYHLDDFTKHTPENDEPYYSLEDGRYSVTIENNNTGYLLCIYDECGDLIRSKGMKTEEQAAREAGKLINELHASEYLVYEF